MCIRDSPQSLQQENNFWKFRDDLVEAYKLEGKYITNDISLPLNSLLKFIDVATKKLTRWYMEHKYTPLDT